MIFRKAELRSVINSIEMNLSEMWATRQGRIRIILLAIILATIPCYCAGLIILMIDPQPAGSSTPTATLTETLLTSPTRTPPTLVYFESPTVTKTGTITQSPTASKTYAIPATNTAVPSSTPTNTPVPSDTPTLEPSLTEIPSATDTMPALPTDTPNPTP